MELIPVGDRIVVEIIDPEEKIGNVIIPENARGQSQRGRVLAVGPGGRTAGGELVPIALAEGDEVVFSKYGGTEVSLSGEDYLLLHESDVLAKAV